MLNVGVHVVVVNAPIKNEKGTLSQGFTAVSEKKQSAMEALMGGSLESGDTASHSFLIFPPNLIKFDQTPNTAAEISAAFSEYRAQLTHILSQFVTVDKIKFDPFANTGVTETNFLQKLIEQGTVDKMYANYTDQYITQMSAVKGLADKKFRLILVRQSKNKHFPKLRSKFLADQPFLEAIEIPAESSKIKFTAYEIKNGLNSGEAVEADATPAASPQAAAALFAQTA